MNNADENMTERSHEERLAELEAEGWRLFERLKTAMEDAKTKKTDVLNLLKV